MTEQNELLLTDEELKAELVKYCVETCQTNPPQMPNYTDMVWCCVKAQVAKVKKFYPIMYQEEAEFIGSLLDKGWIPPEEAKVQKHRLDRPELEKEICKILKYPYSTKATFTPVQKLLALIPDEKEIRKQMEEEFALRYNPDYLDFQKGVETTEKIWKVKVEEAKREERERIKKLLDDMDMICPESDSCSACDEFRQALKGER